MIGMNCKMVRKAKLIVTGNCLRMYRRRYVFSLSIYKKHTQCPRVFFMVVSVLYIYVDVSRSAVTVGTVWAMDRKWFHEVGGFDEGMQKWGGENLDLAVRVCIHDITT